MIDISSEIKRLDVEQAKLAKVKAKLLKEAKKQEAVDAKLDKLVKSSGFKTPRELVDALVSKYGLRGVRGGKAKAAKPGKVKARRKKTKVTAALRDAIKADFKAKAGPSAICRKHGVSYAVVANVKKGAYDKLK